MGHDDVDDVPELTDATPESHRRGALVLVALVGLALAGVVASQLLKPAPATPLGIARDIAGAQVMVESMECSTNPLPGRDAGSAPLTATGQFCVATLRFTDATRPLRLDVAAMRLHTSAGANVAPDPAANAAAHTGASDTAIRAGSTARAQVAFDVAPADRPTRLTLVVTDAGKKSTAVFMTPAR